MFSPDDIADLACWLRQNGFAVGSEQLIACGRVLHGSRRFDAAALRQPEMARWLGPIFCQSGDEQARFGGVYREWLLQRGWMDAVAADDEADAAPVKLTAKQRRALWWFATVEVLGTIAFIWAVYAGDHYRKAKPVIEKPPASQTSQSASASTGATGQAKQAIKLMPLPVISSKKEYRVDPVSCMLLAALLAGSVGWYLFHSLRRRGFLQRLPADSHHAETFLRSSSVRPLGLWMNDLRKVGIGLRRRQKVASRELDVPASLEATVRAGGLVRLVFGSRVEPDYLVLVDKAGPGDHQARLFDEMLAALDAQGLQMERYEFDADPRRARHAPLKGASSQRGLQSLERLASRHAGSRLIIFSDGRGLIDPYTGRVQAWLSQLEAWARPVLMTPQARWGAREWLLAQAGLVLLPLNGDGLPILGSLFDSERPAPAVEEAAQARPRPAYLKQQDSLLDQIAPSLAAVEKLLAQLQADLGEDGMAWLAGCAIYPELHWGLSLQLGQSLLAPAGPAGRHGNLPAWQMPDRTVYAQRLAQLVRLPWLRQGFMPDWLRQALLARLPLACTQVLHAAIQAFLAQVVQVEVQAGEQAGADWLRVVLPSNAGQWHDAWRGLRLLLRWQAHKRASAKAVNEAVAEDKVFLRFMSVPKQGLTVAAGDYLTRLLYRHGVPLAGPRVLPLLVVGALLGGVALLRPPVTVAPTTQVCDVCPQMVMIPAGSFMMGDANSSESDEKPVHKVSVASFALSQTEVTQGQWRALMGNNPSRFKDCGDNCPVENVSWDDAQAYVKKLSELTRQRYRLPSEAEWEYAARAGTTTAYPWGEQPSHEYANYGKDECCAGLASGRDKWVNTAPVASFPANSFGLHDMHGNVWEWVEDCYHAIYDDVPRDGRVWNKDCQKDSRRVLRGGSWGYDPVFLRSANRNGNAPTDRNVDVGLRVAWTPP